MRWNVRCGTVLKLDVEAMSRPRSARPPTPHEAPPRHMDVVVFTSRNVQEGRAALHTGVMMHGWIREIETPYQRAKKWSLDRVRVQYVVRDDVIVAEAMAAPAWPEARLLPFAQRQRLAREANLAADRGERTSLNPDIIPLEPGDLVTCAFPHKPHEVFLGVVNADGTITREYTRKDPTTHARRVVVVYCINRRGTIIAKRPIPAPPPPKPAQPRRPKPTPKAPMVLFGGFSMPRRKRRRYVFASIMR